MMATPIGGASKDRRMLQVLNGTPLDPPPVWLMRQAGRYLPEYRRVREQAGSFLDLCFNPELAAEVTLQPIRRFGFDASILFADILLVPHAVGQNLWFETGEGPRLTPVTSAAELSALSAAEASERLSPVMETVERLRRDLPAETTLIGFAGAPWTVATYMIAGRGSPDQADAKLAAYRDPGFVDGLLDLLVEVTADYLSAQVEAGCDVLQIFDTWAGGLSPSLMERCVLDPTKALIARVKARHPEVPVIGFPRAIGWWMGVYVRETGIDALGLGTGENVTECLKTLPPGLPVQGNLDPLVLLSGGDSLKEAVLGIKAAMGDRPYIFNLGHGILPPTPPDHVEELLRLVRQPN